MRELKVRWKKTLGLCFCFEPRMEYLGAVDGEKLFRPAIGGFRGFRSLRQMVGG